MPGADRFTAEFYQAAEEKVVSMLLNYCIP